MVVVDRERIDGWVDPSKWIFLCWSSRLLNHTTNQQQQSNKLNKLANTKTPKRQNITSILTSSTPQDVFNSGFIRVIIIRKHNIHTILTSSIYCWSSYCQCFPNVMNDTHVLKVRLLTELMHIVEEKCSGSDDNTRTCILKTKVWLVLFVRLSIQLIKNLCHIIPYTCIRVQV